MSKPILTKLIMQDKSLAVYTGSLVALAAKIGLAKQKERLTFVMGAGFRGDLKAPANGGGHDHIKSFCHISLGQKGDRRGLTMHV